MVLASAILAKFKLSEAEHEPPLLVLGAEPQELSLGGFLANLHGAGEECPRNLGYDVDINRSTERRGGYLIPGALHTEEAATRAGQRTRAKGQQKGAGELRKNVTSHKHSYRALTKACLMQRGDYFFPAFAVLAALPFSSTTITSIPLSLLVFSGKWVMLAAYCASPALEANFSFFPSG